MKRLFLRNDKSVIIQAADSIEITRLDYPLATIVIVRRRSLRSFLKRIHSALVNFVPTEAQLRHWTDWLIRASETAETVLKLVVITWVVYLVIEVVLAFMPGGPAHRLIGGGQ